MRTASAGPVDNGGEPVRHEAVLSLLGTQAEVHELGMVLPANLPERAWERIGTNLRGLANSSAWWLADWLTFGEATYGWRRYKEAIERTGLDYQTLRNYAWVGRRFDHSRRRAALSFAHHAEVARLAPPEQDYWLRKAEQQNWSRNELRRMVRASLAAQSETPRAPADGDGQNRDVPRLADSAAAGKRRQKVTTLTIELSTSQLEHYARAAAAHGLPVGEWVTQVLETVERQTPDRLTA
ncbi:LmbU family transcriptional regulator [Streptomyces sp. NPDC050504]|uniref:LmbU family transcriptional regulator n=1 Tax=Streptomyces sp. NPDC050504 TaxID=3365618 RepID=UPI0037A3A00A